MSEDPNKYKSDPPCGNIQKGRIGPHGNDCGCAFPEWDVELGQNIHSAAVSAVVRYLSAQNPETVKEAVEIYQQKQ